MTTAQIAAGAGRLSRLALRIDRVVLAGIAIIAVLAIADPLQAPRSVLFAADALLGITPFIVLSVALAAAATATGADAQIGRVFGGSPWITIAAAALFGALSPFCSCGVIPLIAALLAAGVPLAPVMAFWVSSPLMDPEMFVLTLAGFDLPFALARVGSAVVMGLGAGFATQLLVNAGWLAQPLRRGTGCGTGCGTACAPDLEPAPLVWRFWRDPARRTAFATQARESAWFLAKWLGLAFVVESLMVAYVPADLIGAWLDGTSWWTIPAAAAVGVPTYLNGYAAIPTVSRLIEFGMDPGAALTFMTAGEVTSIPAAMAVFAIVRRGVFGWYLAVGFFGAMLVGLAYQAVAV